MMMVMSLFTADVSDNVRKIWCDVTSTTHMQGTPHGPPVLLSG